MNKLLEKIKSFNIDEDFFFPFGFDKGKINHEILEKLEKNNNGKLILVTAINPTKEGEGKTTLSIGLSDGLNLIGKKSLLSLREPSMGPVFGIKGGATGGGLSSLEPKLDINLHFNGDFHAITSAHNLISAVIDSHIYFKNELKFKTVLWNRALDVNDRALRKIKLKNRDDSFIITAASEIMASLALSINMIDLKNRLEKILIGIDEDNNFIFLKSLNITNAIITILKDTLNPNVVLTKEKNLALIHLGPFANIAHGCSSLIATKLALKLADYVVTEAGFGSDLGMEKFLNIKAPLLKKEVDLVVLTTTLKSLKVHGKAFDVLKEDINTLNEGIKHLEKHIENIKSFNLNFIIALNKHSDDFENEINYFFLWAKNNNYIIKIADGFKNGAKGMENLAKAVVEKIDEKNPLAKINRPYNLEDAPIDKIYKVATKIYGASNVEYSPKALKQLELYMGVIRNLPLCIAKTPLSFSADSSLLGVPKDFTITINEITPSLGAGFFVAKTKGINLMPGLGKDSKVFNFNDK